MSPFPPDSEHLRNLKSVHPLISDLESVFTSMFIFTTLGPSYHRVLSLYKPLSTSSDGDFEDIWGCCGWEFERRFVKYRSVKGRSFALNNDGIETSPPDIVPARREAGLRAS